MCIRDSHKVDSYLLSDGGLWANNPSLAAIIEAQKRLNIEIGDIKVLSIGTGHARNEYGVKKQRKWGFLNGWRKKEFINFILSLQSQSAFNYLKLLLRQDQYLRIDFESDKELSLDDANTIEGLTSKADRDFTYNSEDIRQFL